MRATNNLSAVEGAASMDEQVRAPILAAALFENVDHGNGWAWQERCDVSHRRCFVSALG